MTPTLWFLAIATPAALLGVAWWPSRLALRWWRERRLRRKVRRWFAETSSGPLTLEQLDRAIAECDVDEAPTYYRRPGDPLDADLMARLEALDPEAHG